MKKGKEMNKEVLRQLYEIAGEVWARMVKLETGTYRASEVNRKMGKAFFLDLQDFTQTARVSAGAFSCEFPLQRVFCYVTAFEQLTNARKNAQRFTCEEVTREKGVAEFEISKDMVKTVLAGIHQYFWSSTSIVIDCVKNHCFAVDGKIQFPPHPIHFTYKEGTIGSFTLSGEIFAKMCNKGKKGKPRLVRVRKFDAFGGPVVVDFDGIMYYNFSIKAQTHKCTKAEMHI